MNRRFVIATALLVPALAFVSCKDDGNTNPIGPDNPTLGNPTTPSTQQRGKFGGSDHKVRLPQPSAAAVAEAVRADLAVGTLSHPTGGPHAPHDPTVGLMRMRCVDGAEFGFGPATSDPFRTNHGCEHNTMTNGPIGTAAIALPFQNLTRGRRVANTTHLQFRYAGGPAVGGNPRFSLFTDFCRANPPNSAVTPQHNPPGTRSCAGGTGTTDGEWDETLFIDAAGCNDGDVYVGAVIVKNPNATLTDPTCTITEAYGPDGASGTGDEHTHTNWADYLAAHPNDRFAQDFGPANGDALADNFIINDRPPDAVDPNQGTHYHVHWVNMRANLGPNPL